MSYVTGKNEATPLTCVPDLSLDDLVVTLDAFGGELDANCRF